MIQWIEGFIESWPFTMTMLKNKEFLQIDLHSCFVRCWLAIQNLKQGPARARHSVNRTHSIHDNSLDRWCKITWVRLSMLFFVPLLCSFINRNLTGNKSKHVNNGLLLHVEGSTAFSFKNRILWFQPEDQIF